MWLVAKYSDMRKEDHSLVEFSYKEKNKYEFQPEIDQQQESGLFEDELHTELWIKVEIFFKPKCRYWTLLMISTA